MIKALRWIGCCIALSLLAACATAPTPSSPHPAHPAAPVPKPTVSPTAPAAATAAQEATPAAIVIPADVWESLRGSFAMTDCDSDPGISLWAHRFTQNPQHFESLMSDALPQIVYIQQVAEKYGVAGEFVLLPWVESQFRPVQGHRNMPAGMWQIVPSTAHVIGLHADRGYDGRLDTSASTEGVMRMLADYHRQMHDWRLVDYSFNLGQYGIQKLVARYGVPPPEPAIPKMPVPKITREHLTKLLAIACVVREPARFNVELPTLAADEHLETVELAHSTSVARAATQAGMPVDTLRRLNPGLRSDNVDSQNVAHLMMPRRNAEQWRNASATTPGSDSAAVASSASTPAAPASNTSSSSTSNNDETPAPGGAHKARTYKVRNGDTLGKIASDTGVSVKNLQRLNKLRGSAIKPGQILKLGN